MGNISHWMQEFEKQNNEIIEAIVVGEHYNDPDRWEPNRKPKPNEGVVLSREQGLAILDQEYDNGFGGADCYPMYAWTKNWVLLIGEYDGSTGLNWVPRNPVDCQPSFGGA